MEDPCASDNPCHPVSACVAVNGIATCGPCPDNMNGNGKVCHTKNPCLAKPCFDGVDCQVDEKTIAGYSCGSCPFGFRGNGTHCRHRHVDACLSNPCFEGVKCSNNGDDTFECGSCPEHTEGNGVECKIKLTPEPCVPNPCFKVVECYPTGTDKDSFKCGLCPSGTVGNGMTCEPTPCASKPCYPTVTCIDVGKVSYKVQYKEKRTIIVLKKTRPKFLISGQIERV
jgi:hypothetical protein